MRHKLLYDLSGTIEEMVTLKAGISNFKELEQLISKSYHQTPAKYL